MANTLRDEISDVIKEVVENEKEAEYLVAIVSNKIAQFIHDQTT